MIEINYVENDNNKDCDDEYDMNHSMTFSSQS